MTIESRVPKTLASACQKYADRIDEVFSEGPDGYWIILRNGFWNPYSETTCIHEWTVKDCLWQLPLIAIDTRPENKR